MRTMVLSFIFALGFSFSAYSEAFLPQVVKELDLNQYVGRWYQIASTEPVFQKGCVCTTADYALKSDGTVGVINSCRQKTPDGELKVVEGVARPTSNQGKFRVDFGGFKLPFSNYWIVDLANDYSYAVVSGPLGRPIWILNREPQLDTAVYSDIIAKLAARGFRTDLIKITLQTGCRYD